MNNRIDYIDILRGFAIFLVTLGHIIEKSGYKESPLFTFIYSFHMPLFFCISGFICAYVYDKRSFSGSSDGIFLGGGKSFIINKLRFVIIPYLVWSLLVKPFFFYTYNGELNWMTSFRAACINNTSYWFLPCLFGLMVCYCAERIIGEYFKVKKTLINLLVIAVIAISLVGILKITHYDFFRSILSYYIPFWIGIFMSRYRNLYVLVTENKLIYAVFLILFCLIEGLFIGREDILLGKVVRLVCGVLALPIMFNFFKHLQLPQKFHNMMCYVGQNTLVIYLMQFSFFKGMLEIPAGLNIFYQITLFTILSAIMMGLILFIANVIGQSIYLRQILLGKSRL